MKVFSFKHDDKNLRWKDNRTRRYYIGDQYFIKEIVVNGEENKKTVSNLISFYQNNKELIASLPIPKLIDWSEEGDKYRFVFDSIKGTNVADKIDSFDNQQKKEIVQQTVKITSILEKNGIYHNDIRSWNLIVNRDSKNNLQTILIDFDNAKSIETESSLESILWLMFDLNAGIVKNIDHSKETKDILLVPPSDYGIFSNIAAAIIDKKVTNMQELLSFIEKNNNQ